MTEKANPIEIAKNKTNVKFSGQTKIQLFDGENLVNEIVDENMMTNALNDILNPDRVLVSGEAVEELYENFLPLYKKALGGVLLYEEPIEENADITLAPLTNKCVGHAGDNYGGEVETRGTLNTAETGFIDDADRSKGYRFVWDFPTDRANGVISCVCLTSTDGGNNGFGKGIDYESDNSARWLADRVDFGSDTGASGVKLEGVTNGVPIGTYNGEYVVAETTTGGTLRLHFSKNDDIVFNISDDKTYRIEEYTIPIDNVVNSGVAFYSNGEIIVANKSSSSAFEFAEFDLSTRSFGAAQTRTFSPDVYAADRVNYPARYCYKTSNYWYFLGAITSNNNREVWRYPEQGGTGVLVGEVSFGTGGLANIKGRWSSIGDYAVWINGSGGIAKKQIVIFDKDDPEIAYKRTINNVSFPSAYSNIIINPDDSKEIVAFYKPSSATPRLASFAFTPYIASINNLANPVTKIASQTMKITYEVRPESEGEE